MKIHEYQGKKIFSDYGMPVQDGYIFEKIEDAEKTIKRVQKEAEIAVRQGVTQLVLSDKDLSSEKLPNPSL